MIFSPSSEIWQICAERDAATDQKFARKLCTRTKEFSCRKVSHICPLVIISTVSPPPENGIFFCNSRLHAPPSSLAIYGGDSAKGCMQVQTNLGQWGRHCRTLPVFWIRPHCFLALEPLLIACKKTLLQQLSVYGFKTASWTSQTCLVVVLPSFLLSTRTHFYPATIYYFFFHFARLFRFYIKFFFQTPRDDYEFPPPQCGGSVANVIEWP